MLHLAPHGIKLFTLPESSFPPPVLLPLFILRTYFLLLSTENHLEFPVQPQCNSSLEHYELPSFCLVLLPLMSKSQAT